MRNCEQTIYVDADACPVKDEIEDLCQKYNKNVIFVASYAHAMKRRSTSITIMVDSHKEEADLYIVNHCKRGDIVVTQDHALAALLLPKGVFAISPRGKQFLEEDMNELLLARHLGKKQRRAGMKTKGPNKFTNEDVLTFCKQFEKILSIKEGI